MKTSTNRYSAFDTAIYYLGFKSRTSKEIHDKLVQKMYTDEEISTAMDKLSYYGYIDDNQYITNYIKDNLHRKGKSSIVADLRQKGINKESVLTQFEDFDIDEYGVICDIMSRRFSMIDFNDDKQKRRVLGYFVRRGFRQGDVIKAIKALCVTDEYLV